MSLSYLYGSILSCIGKPAGPDSVDWEETALDVVTEVRDRFSIYKGNKARGMAPEKQLKYVKCLLLLQNPCELKADGITLEKD